MRPHERVEQAEARLASVGREERVVEDDLMRSGLATPIAEATGIAATTTPTRPR